MFKGGYGVLRLMPRQLRELTPGEYGDMMEARLWAMGAKQDTPPRVMTPDERALKLKQLDTRIQESRAQHR